MATPIPEDWLDEINASKEASNRQKDNESLPRLRSFREYWLRHRQ